MISTGRISNWVAQRNNKQHDGAYQHQPARPAKDKEDMLRYESVCLPVRGDV